MLVSKGTLADEMFELFLPDRERPVFASARAILPAGSGASADLVTVAIDSQTFSG